MAVMREAIDTTTLGWIKPELDEILRQARQEIETFAQNPGDPSRMRACAGHLHQVHGTLRMIELVAPAMVAEEMERLAVALQQGAVADSDEACAALMRGVLQLPDYLERLQGGHRDIPIVLLPLLNELRACRGEPGLSESVLFSPDLDRPLPAHLPSPMASSPPSSRATVAPQLAALRAALATWPEDRAPADPAQLAVAIDSLLADVELEPLRRMLWVASSVAGALRDGALPPTKALRQAFSGVEREARQLLEDDGFGAAPVEPAADPTRQLLYHVAHSDGRHHALDDLRQTFQLDAELPSESELAHARGSLSGHNRALLDTVSAVIKDDLMRVKDALDLYLRTGQTDVAQLHPQVEALTRASDTLGMMDLGIARGVVLQQRDCMREIVAGRGPADETALLDIAGALLYVDASLDDHVSRLGLAAGTADDDLLASESRKVLDIVVREAIANFGHARQSFVAFVETHWDHAELAEVPRLLDEVSGALRILELPLPASYLLAVRRYTQVELIERGRVPNGQQLDTLADALASLEYYLEALRDQRPHREDILDIARQSLERLRYWPLPEPTSTSAVAAPFESPGSVESDVAAVLDPVVPVVPAVEAPEPAPVAAGAGVGGFEHSDDIDDEIREVFLEELEEEISNLGQLLPSWRQAPDDGERLHPIRRVFHTLKGSGRLVGAKALGEYSWKVENLLSRVLDGTRPASVAVIALVGQVYETLPQLHAALQGSGRISADLAGMQEIADRLAAGEEVLYVPASFAPPQPTTEPEIIEPAVELADALDKPGAEPIEAEPELAVAAEALVPAAIEEPSVPASIDPVLLEILGTEVNGHLVTIEQWLADVQSAPQPADDRMQRAIHTLNGAFAMTEVPVITEVTAPTETYVMRLFAAGVAPTDEGVAAMAAVAVAIRRTLVTLGSSQPRVPVFEGLAARMIELRDSLPVARSVLPVDYPADLEFEGGEDETLTAFDLSAYADMAAQEAERVETERVETERVETERVETERVETERVEAERLEAERVETERVETERVEAERLETERAEAERVEAERVEEQERLEYEALEAEYAEADRRACEQKIEAERMAAEQATAGNDEIAEATEVVVPRALDGDEPVAEHEELAAAAAEQAGDDATTPPDEADGAVVGDTESARAIDEDALTVAEFDSVQAKDAQDTADLHEEDAELAEPAVAALLDSLLPPVQDPDEALDLTGLDPELVHIFVEEGGDLLDHSDGLLARLRQAPSESESVVGLQRDLHTLKGGARMAGIMAVGELSHVMESLLEAVIENRRELGRDGVPLLERGFDRLHAMVTRVGSGRAIAIPEELIQEFDARSRGDTYLRPSAAAVSNDQTHPEAAKVELKPLSAPIGDSPMGEDDDIDVRAPQEQVRIRADLLDRLVNYAGEVAIYRARLEQQLGAFRGAIAEMEATNTRVRDQLRRLEIETEAQIIARYQREHETSDATFDPLELDRFSTLQQLSRGLSESAADQVSLQGTLDDLTRQYETLLLQQSRVSSDLQEGLMRTRMVPFDGLLPRLRRVVRQASGELGKQVQLQLEGTQGELDRNVLERMTAPLEHMLRNCVAHGLELPARRKQAGKPEEGTIHLAVRREGSEVVLEVGDDGAGLDRVAIRRRGEERGLVRSDAVLSDADLDRLILEPGFSTVDEVSRLAGRGVGLDVVVSEVRQLGGTIDIHSNPGQGVTFTLRLPQTLAVTQAVFVRIGETSFAVPIASVRGVGRISRDMLARDPLAGVDAADPVYRYAGEDYPVHDLGVLLGHAPAKAEGHLQMPVLLIRSGELRAAVTVDQVVGNREIVVKPVGPQVASVPGIFGATIMGDGRVVVILDVAPLVRRRAALPRDHVPVPVTAPEQRRVPLVMVVDDSVTMRKVIGRVLERHNFEVLTAKDGLDALERMTDVVPDLMLLDIEMPRMDGYELATAMKAEPRLRNVPIMMITSRTGDKHRQRAFDLGVNRYLGKPYQEPELLRNVYELLRIDRDHE